jgi:hypothetical protein
MTLTTIFILLVSVGVFAFKGEAQISQFPNEVQDFDFFGNGRLNGLKLGKSKRQDVERILGEACGKFCDYDENFRIQFFYIGPGRFRNQRYGGDRQVCPRPEFVGTISSVQLTAKRPINFSEVSMEPFQIVGGGEASPLGEYSKRNEFLVFGDEFGLKYSVFSTKSHVKSSNREQYERGNLYKIEYYFSEEFERSVFTSEITCVEK